MGWFDENAPGDPNATQGDDGLPPGGVRYPQSVPGDDVSGNPVTPPPGTPTTPSPAPTAPTPTAPQPSSGDPDRDAVIKWARENHRPDIENAPDYWVNEVKRTGGAANAGNWAYWANRMGGTDSSGNEPGRMGGGGPGTLGGIVSGQFLTPYGETFDPGEAYQGNGQFDRGENFVAPDFNETTDPGLEARRAMGQQGVERSAAARGTLLTGGTLKDIAKFNQDYASNEYQNVYNRALGAHTTNYGERLGAHTTNFGEGLQVNQNAYNQKLGKFGTNYDVFRNNQTDPYNKLFGVTQLGLNAANGANSAANSRGNQAGQNTNQAGGLI